MALPIFIALVVGQNPQHQTSQADLDQVVALYRSYGLPLPPASASFVEIGQGYSSGEGTLYNFGYALRPADKPNEVVVMVDGQEVTHHSVKPAEPTRLAAKRTWIRSGRRSFMELDTALWLALAEGARGHNEFALALLDRTHDPRKPLEQRVATFALHHWMQQLLDSGTDRAAISTHLHSLVRKHPELDDPYTKYVLERLDLTVNGRYSGSDANEKLVDSLCDHDERPGVFPPFSMLAHGKQADRPIIKAIVSIGFEVVPALIRHLDDERLTRSAFVGFNNFQPYHLTVGDICRDILYAYSDKYEMYPFRRRTFDKAQILKWWNEAKALGERTYLAQRVSYKTKASVWGSLLIDMAKARHPDLLQPPKD
jgi:hypothetical protein